MKVNLFTLLIVVLFATISYAQMGWHTQNSGTTKFLLDVYFVDQITGWACGQTGTILRTTDGGVIWTNLNAPPNNAYYSIYFVNNSIGWAVGSSGSSEFIHTTDGGNTWAMQSSPTPHSTSDVYFVNADTGWAVGGKGRDFTDPIREISCTTNGGATWTTQYTGNNENPLGTVYFVNENQGWAVGSTSTIMHTSDGGNNWTFQMSGPGYEFEDVYFLNPDTGWVVGEDLSLSHNAVIFNTTDGGATWVSQIFGSDDSFQGVQFVNANTGWVVGGSNAEAIVLHTTDGGVNWTPQNPGTSNFLSGLYFVDENNGWAVGFDGTIIHTNTGGIVGLQDKHTTIPGEVTLYENYPNPFNPATTIRYNLSEKSQVSLIIYDITGQKIRALKNEPQTPGEKSIVWNGRNNKGQIVASGVYIYQLCAGGIIKTKKMIYLK